MIFRERICIKWQAKTRTKRCFATKIVLVNLRWRIFGGECLSQWKTNFHCCPIKVSSDSYRVLLIALQHSPDQVFYRQKKNHFVFYKLKVIRALTKLANPLGDLIFEQEPF